MANKYWTSPVGCYDDFNKPIKDQVIDGKTKAGPWALMTPETHKLHGCGLGIGLGQLYEKQKDGKWLQIK